MDVIGWYLLFAVTTSLTFMYEVFVPVIREIAVAQPNHNIVEHKYISYTVYFLLALLIAPLLLPVCLIPSFGVTFRDRLFETIMEP